MTIEAAIFDRLSNYAGLSALVSSRIYPVEAPQNVTDPFVTYSRVSGVRIGALKADTGIASPRYQISSWSKNHDTAVSVAEQVRAALQRYSGTNASVEILDCILETEVDLYDPDTEYHQRITDFEIWHRE